MAYEISLLTVMGIAVIFALSLNLITGFQVNREIVNIQRRPAQKQCPF